jgi:magnesium transporter
MRHTLDFNTGLLPDQMHHPIGEFVIPVQTAFDEELTVGELLNLLPQQSVDHHTHYIYTLDSHGRLIGVVSTRQILFNSPDTTLKELAHTHIIQIESNAPLKEGLKIMKEHELLAVPVIDKDMFLLGIFEIPHTAFKHLEKPPKGKELFQMIGLSLEQHSRRSCLLEYSYRMPWLIFNIVGGLSCAYIGSLFHNLLDEIVVISMFIPLVLTLGESIAMQSMALSLEFIQYGQIPWRKVRARLKLDAKTSLIIGATSALVTGLAYTLAFQDALPMAAITTSIIVSMIIAAQIGALAPALLHSLKLDPKVAAGPVALMVTDICVTILYLSIASLILMH